MANFEMLIGPAASGKSTYAVNRKLEGWIVISSDELRGEWYGDVAIQGNPALLFNELHKRVVEALKNGCNVVFDATNLRIKHRTALIQRIPKDVHKIAIIFAAPYNELKIRNLQRARVVPEDVIWNQIRSFQMVLPGEGFDDIKIITEETGYWSNLLGAMNNFEQDHPKHTHNLAVHCHLASELIDLDESPELFIATAVHDYGKILTKTFTDARGNPSKIAHFYNHENVGAYVILYHNCSASNKAEIAQLINYHMVPYELEKAGDKAINKWKRLMGKRLWNDIQTLHWADKEAK